MSEKEGAGKDAPGAQVDAVHANQAPAIGGHAAEAAARRIPSVAELFWGFFVVGVTGFGGVLPFARRMIVEQRRWLTPQEFTDLFSLCQFMPGPNIVSMSMVMGQRFHGPLGAAACLIGIMGAPFLIVIGLGVLYTSYGDVPEVKAVMRGLAAAAAGLFVAMAFKMIGAAPRTWRMLFGVVAFVAIGLMRVPLAMVLAVLAPLSIAAAWYKK